MKVIIKKIKRDSYDNERVLMEVIEDCNLSHYLLFVKTYEENGIETNKLRHLYILDSIDVHKGDFVSLYTRQKNEGDDYSFKNKKGTTTFQCFWGLKESIWNNEGDTAYLVHYDDWMKKNDISD